MASKKRSKSIFDSKFTPSAQSSGRKENVRTEREVHESMPLLCFNFKDFDHAQCPPGQTFEQWQSNGRLATLMKKLEDVCQMTRTEAELQQVLKVYGDFPRNSGFKKPAYIQGEVSWATIQRIGGQKPRLAGYIIGSIFYPVFLDEEHCFYPSETKHT